MSETKDIRKLMETLNQINEDNSGITAHTIAMDLDISFGNGQYVNGELAEVEIIDDHNIIITTAKKTFIITIEERNNDWDYYPVDHG